MTLLSKSMKTFGGLWKLTGYKINESEHRNINYLNLYKLWYKNVNKINFIEFDPYFDRLISHNFISYALFENTHSWLVNADLWM